MTSSFEAFASPAAAGGVVVSTGGQKIAQAPVHLLVLLVSAVKAYRVAVAWLNPPVMARIFAKPAGFDPPPGVPRSWRPSGNWRFQNPPAAAALRDLPVVLPPPA